MVPYLSKRAVDHAGYTLDELKSEAISKLERRGYDVRGKTPAQIRQILRARSPRSKTTAKSPVQTMDISDDKQN
jgi:hypothetical protein